MGRVHNVTTYEITPEIKELQKLAETLSFIGTTVNVDITQDLVTINGWQKMDRATAKQHLEELIANSKISQGSNEFPDREQQAREAKALAKQQKKHREPGTPPEFKTILRRSKRIYKKATIKGLSTTEASLKASKYLQAKATAEDLPILGQHLLNYIAKEMA